MTQAQTPSWLQAQTPPWLGSPPDPSTQTAPPTPPTVEYGEGTELRYRGQSIRVLPVNSVPWFGLPDLADALGLSFAVADKVVHTPNFPAYARRVCLESPEPDPDIPGEPGEVTLLSPCGVWWLTALTDDWGGQGVAAWAKREAARMCPTPTPGDPAVFLGMVHGGVLPPPPTKYSGRKSEWLDLRYSPEGMLAKVWRPETPGSRSVDRKPIFNSASADVQ